MNMCPRPASSTEVGVPRKQVIYGWTEFLFIKRSGRVAQQLIFLLIV